MWFAEMYNTNMLLLRLGGTEEYRHIWVLVLSHNSTQLDRNVEPLKPEAFIKHYYSIILNISLLEHNPDVTVSFSSLWAADKQEMGFVMSPCMCVTVFVWMCLCKCAGRRYMFIK